MAGYTIKPYKRPQLLQDSTLAAKKSKVIFNGSSMDAADAEFYDDPPLGPPIEPSEDMNIDNSVMTHSPVSTVRPASSGDNADSEVKRRKLERYNSTEAVALL